MNVLVLRPEPAASRTARALARIGHEAVVAPLFEAVALNGGFVPLPPPGEPYRCVIAASGNAFALIDGESRDALAGLPALVVGARTAAAARTAGLRPVPHYRTAADLAEALIAEPPAGHILYLAGRDRRPDIERALENRAFTLAEVYATPLVEKLPETARRALSANRVEAVLHYSARSARAYAVLAERAGLAEAALAPAQLCLSLPIATLLADAGAKAVSVAAAADEAHLLALLP